MGADAWAVLEVRDHGRFPAKETQWVALVGPDPLDCRDYLLFCHMLETDLVDGWDIAYSLSDSRGFPEDMSSRADQWFESRSRLGSGWLTLSEAKALVQDHGLQGSRLDTRAIPMMASLSTTLELKPEEVRIIYHITHS